MAPNSKSPNETGNDHPAFRANSSSDGFAGKALRGGIITVIAQGTRFALYMGSTIVLARLLSTEDFGLVAMVGALTSFLRVFREAGLNTATVQKEGITHSQVSNLFWINAGLGAIATLTGVVLSPAVAWFFQEERLVGITIGLTLTFLFSGSSVQHIALLNRQMRFKAIALVDIFSTSLGAGIGIGMALTGWGYWSLVGSQVGTALSEMLFAWSFSRWRPQLPSRNAGTRGLLNFGASLTFATLLRRIFSSSDSLLIGRVWGAEPLGLYSRGMALLMRPLDQLVYPFDVVFVPILSRLQDQPDRYRSTYLKVISAIALVSFPVAGLLLALSQPLVLLMLGSRWAEVIPIFAAMSLAAIYYPAACVTNWLPTTQGRNRDIRLIGVTISFLTVGGVLAGLAFGVAAVAWASSLFGLLLRLPLQFHIGGREGPVSRSALWRVFLLHLPLYAVVTGTTYFAQQAMVAHSSLTQIAVAAPLGIVAGGVVALLMPPLRRTAFDLLNRARGLMLRTA